MNTLLNVAFLTSETYDLCKSKEEFFSTLDNLIPWIILPDVYLYYDGKIKESHFNFFKKEYWMKFPVNLKELDIEKFIPTNKITHTDYFIFPCKRKQDTQMDIFDIYNYDHPYYYTLRIHLEQDMCLNKITRTLVAEPYYSNVTIFRSKKDNTEFDAGQFCYMSLDFHMYAYLYICGEIYKKTGELLNNDWYQKHVFNNLYNYYPEYIANNIVELLKIPNDINNLINTHQFHKFDNISNLIVNHVNDFESICKSLFHFGKKVTRTSLKKQLDLLH